VLTAEQLELRRTGITATEVAAIVGVNPFAGPMDVYLAKTGEQTPDDENEAMRWGSALEPVVLERYARDRGVELTTPGTLRHPTHPELLGTPDAVVVAERRGVEVTTTGAHRAHEWGAPGTDEIPAHYWVQCAVYMAICDADAWDVAVLIGGQDYRVYTVERDRDVEAWLVDSAVRFWRDHVAIENPPPIDGRRSTARFLTDRFPANNGAMRGSDLDCELWADRLRDAREAVAAARALELEAENRLKALIAESDGVKGSFFTIYWRRSKDTLELDARALLDALADDDPEIRRRIAEREPAHTRRRSGSRSFRAYFGRPFER
jgi:putative phage-type endonuclease